MFLHIDLWKPTTNLVIMWTTVAVSGFLPGGGEFFLEISSGGGDNLPGGGEKIAL